MIDQISELLLLIHLSTHILSHWNTSDQKDSPTTTEITSCVLQYVWEQGSKKKSWRMHERKIGLKMGSFVFELQTY